MNSTDPGQPPGAAVPRASFVRAAIVLILLMLISASHLFHRVGLAAFSDQVIQRWVYTPFQLGLIQSAFLLTYTTAMVPGGWLADRVGTWRTLLLVSAGTGVFGALIGGAEWLDLGATAAALWIVCVMGSMGLCAAPLFPSTSRTVASWFRPERQVWANALVTAAAICGVAVSSTVLTELGLRLGWSVALAWTGAATLGIATLWAGMGRSTPERVPKRLRPPREPLTWGRFIRHRGILALAVSYGTVGYFQYSFFYWLKYYFTAIRGLEETLGARYAMIPILAMMVGTPLGGIGCSFLARRQGLRRALPLCSMVFMGFAAAFLAAGALTRASEPEDMVVWFSLASAFIGMSEGPFWTTAVRLGGKFGGTAGGVVNMGGNLGGLLAPALTPLIAELVGGSDDPYRGWTAAILTTSVAVGAGLFFWLAVDPDDIYAEEA